MTTKRITVKGKIIKNLDTIHLNNNIKASRSKRILENDTIHIHTQTHTHKHTHKHTHTHTQTHKHTNTHTHTSKVSK